MISKNKGFRSCLSILTLQEMQGEVFFADSLLVG